MFHWMTGNTKKFRLTLLMWILTCTLFSDAQAPFQKEILAFKKADSLAFPGTGKILFTGSSSFTLWKNVQDDFPGHPIINRGFGGSSLTDLIRYAADVIFPYRSKQIVIYCGENDLAASDNVTGRMVFKRFRQLFGMIRNEQPGVPVAYVSMKPSPSRRHLMMKLSEGNLLIKKFLKKKRNTVFIDVYHTMLKADGTPEAGIFLSDSLHMNRQGYAIWKKLIEPHLLK